MADQFAKYEQDLLETIKSAKTKLADRIPLAENAEQRKSLIRDVHKDISQINLLIQEMEDEMNRAGPNSKISMSNKLKNFKRDIEILQKDLKKASTTAVNTNYGSINPNAENVLDPERRKLLQINNSLNRATDSIGRSTQIAIETEQLGVEVLGELNSQGQQLNRVNTTLNDTQDALSKSRRILNRLSLSLFFNKFFLVIIVFLELCILGAVIYWKFFT